MKALVLTSQGQLAYTDVPEPSPVGEQPVLLRVGAVGVCGSDVRRYAEGKVYHYPLVLGHEISAVIQEAPQGSQYRPGDRFAVFPLLPDYEDPFSRVGEYAVSRGYDYYGSRRDGGFAERLYVPEQNLVPLPPGMPLIYGACVEPAAVALHAVLKLRIPPAAMGLVIGAGPIGAFASQWLRLLGCSRVLVSEVDSKKLSIMESMGFETIDASTQDPVRTMKEVTKGRGADCIVEAGGLPSTFVQALGAAGTFGQVVFLGDVSDNVTLSAAHVSSLLRKELTLYGAWNSKITPPGRSEWDMVVAHISRGDIEIESFISDLPTLENGPAVFAQMVEHRSWHNKVVFVVSEEARAEAKTMNRSAK